MYFFIFAGGSWVNQGGWSLWVWVFQELLLQLGHSCHGADGACRGEKDSDQVDKRVVSFPTAWPHSCLNSHPGTEWHQSVVITLSLHARDNIYFSIWDCWTISGHEDFTLSDFMNAVRVRPTFFTWAVNASLKGHQLLVQNFWWSIDCCTWIYFSGKVWNWANDGGPRREDALRACDARTQQEAQTDVIQFLIVQCVWLCSVMDKTKPKMSLK